MVIQWWCDFEVLQFKFFFFLNINKYYTSLLSNNFDVKKIPISCSTNIQSQNFNIKVLLSTKWQWVYFLQISKNHNFLKEVKNKKKMARTNVVLDQLYQLMVFETPSDHYFSRRSPFRQNFGRPPKKRKITNTKIQDIYHMKEHLICYKMTPKSSLNSLRVRSYAFYFGRHPPEGYAPLC